MRRRRDDRFGAEARIVDRVRGILAVAGAVAGPVELRGVDGGQVDDGERDVDAVVDQFRPQGIGEAGDGELRRAIGR
jgi:hypothetical protein